jgi:hypothetical protein
MSGSTSERAANQAKEERVTIQRAKATTPMVELQGRAEPGRRADCAYVDLGDCARLALMLAPLHRGVFADQLNEVLERLTRHLKSQVQPMTVTGQTVFATTIANRFP